MILQLPRTLGILSLSLGLVWHDPMELLAGVSQPQVTMINGALFIAGVESESGVYKITKLSIDSGESREIETCVCWFGMAAVNEELIIAGGQDCEGESDRVLVMDPHTGTWTEPFPRMPTVRESPSALCYDRWMLVVGGWGDWVCGGSGYCITTMVHCNTSSQPCHTTLTCRHRRQPVCGME